MYGSDVKLDFLHCRSMPLLKDVKERKRTQHMLEVGEVTVCNVCQFLPCFLPKRGM